ncbi:lytic murein transglycosylase [Pseudomonas kuykendallii]|uniref:Membrane-bound lytic murein transglycosylase B n=1 Tax=Pseudomonas kuykendallii TaxID=1007099 RepID=A0A1H2W7K3_9PSED|nr:lytic murein transglycosylase [Pseudomonas kuykendallii]MCQ4273017.1 lytic murein transglycosylase [Pseudomonas kuykendallii]SDW76527.1 membrane-bound lytic murein transglycosylase B [Pseudomonas kuykendallii]
MPYPKAPELTRTLLTGATLAFLSACADNPPQAATTPPAAPAAVTAAASGDAQPVIPPSISFEQWRDGFRSQALNAGIRAEVFDRAFSGVTPDQAVIDADRSQPEFTRPVWEYLDGALSAQRVAKGKALIQQNAALLASIEERYGVEPQTLVAVWGMESNFGQIMGSRSVIRSLATLAYEGRRPGFAQSQLIAALLILQHGDVKPERMIGSWAGAMGQTQFIPTTYDTHAVDFDGDGRRDIWDSSADALASTAHYLQASGWRHGLPWGFEVTLPKGFDYALADADIRKPLREWQGLGIAPPVLPGQLTDESASLLLPAGHRGPAFLVLSNFRAILKYNNSSSYALAIGLLSERFQGAGKVIGEWPRDDLPLSRSERIELQERLSARGYEPGAADSIIGANTRKAIRAYQQSLGWPADGYPSQELIKQLREGR